MWNFLGGLVRLLIIITCIIDILCVSRCVFGSVSVSVSVCVRAGAGTGHRSPSDHAVPICLSTQSHSRRTTAHTHTFPSLWLNPISRPASANKTPL